MTPTHEVECDFYSSKHKRHIVQWLPCIVRGTNKCGDVERVNITLLERPQSYWSTEINGCAPECVRPINQEKSDATA